MKGLGLFFEVASQYTALVHLVLFNNPETASLQNCYGTGVRLYFFV